MHVAPALQCCRCCGAAQPLQQRAGQLAPRSRQRLQVTAMAKRGPKADRKAAKQQRQGQSQQSQDRPPSQPRPQESPQGQRQQQQLPLADQSVRQGATDDSASVTVGDRILPRILLFSGVPVLLGLASLPGFAYLNKAMGIELPVWAVYIISGLFFAAGLGGISYGIFSSSWDANREGSATGLDEFKENVPIFLRKDKD